MPFTRAAVRLEGALPQHVLVTTTVRERLVAQGAAAGPPKAAMLTEKATGNPLANPVTAPLTVPLTGFALTQVMTALVLFATVQQ